MDFIDLHSHILPGLDDGSPDMETSLRLVEGLTELGFSTICATPHQKTGQYLPSLESIRDAHEAVSNEVKGMASPPTIPLGAENMWDATLYERIQNDEIPGYDGNQVFLMEFIPTHLPPALKERLFSLRLKGKLPVLAHPERYAPLWKSKGLQQMLADQCAMVVDLGALAGHHGRKQCKVARKMILSGIAHAVASDTHEESDLESARIGMEWIVKKAGGDRALQRLLVDNPARILAGHHPEG